MNITADLFADDQGTELVNRDGHVVYWPSFLTSQQAQQLFNELLAETPWKQEAIQLYGKMVNQPRLTAWYGEFGLSAKGGYKTPVSASNFSVNLLNLKNKVEACSGKTFNSVLVNLYRNGQDSVAYHADNEAVLGKNPTIASYSLGETRRFSLRHNQAKYETLVIDLQHNSLLLMQGELQHHWQHAINKTKRPIGPRINLTFRNLYPLR
ncbi:MAG: alpha-ketoglutarate-dependent dioxygenase AlkB [Psychromonas sp.]